MPGPDAATDGPFAWTKTCTAEDVVPDGVLACAERDNAIRWREGERLHQLFEARCDSLDAAGRPDHPAVATTDLTLSYRELDDWANRTARHLRSRGVQAGDRIGFLFDLSVETYVALLAILKAGAAYVPFDASFPTERIAYIAADANIRLVVTLSQFQVHFNDIPVELILLDDSADQIASLDSQPMTDGEARGITDQLCYIIYTSGSTGNPKGVAIEHASICNFIRVAGEVYGITDQDRVYQGMTIAFDFSVEELWVPLIAGATLVPGKPGINLLGSDLADFLDHHDVTALCCVPTLLATLERDLPKLRFLLVSGEACPKDLVTRWHRPDRTILNAYGPTEATVTATVTELYPDKPVTIGGPLPTYLIVILDEDGEVAMPKGEIGEICIAGVGLAKEYVNRQDLTQKAFIDDFIGLPNNPSRRIYRTGDLGRVNDIGEIEYHGRIDTQVKIRGYRIELTEIESVLLQVSGIAQAVVSTYQEGGNRELIAYYTRRTDSAAVSTETIVATLRQHLPAYMVPAYFEDVDTIPMLPSNKADRKSLPAPTKPRYGVGDEDFVAPASEMEATLACHLAAALKLEKVSVKANFFDELGCHSLLMAQFCASVWRLLPHLDLSMKDVYLHPTIADLADHLASAVSHETRSGEQMPAHKASTFEYIACGAFQFLFYALFLFGGMWLFVESYRWVAATSAIENLVVRAYLCGTVLLLAAIVLPILVKWIVVGRWRQTEIPIWGPGYFRFWVAREMTRWNPLALTKGTPLFNLYLRLLGAKIGRHAVIDTRFVPVCTDLVTIGDNSVLRKDSILLGYRGQAGWIRTGPITIGRDAVVGEASVIDIDTAMGDGGQLGHGSTLLSGQTIPDGESYHGCPAELADFDYRAVPPKTCTNLRRFLFTLYQLSGVSIGLAGAFVAVYVLLTEIAPNGLPAISSGTTLYVLSVSLALVPLSLVLGLLVIAILSRIFNFLIREDRVYVLYGFRYVIFRFITRASNSLPFNVLFGDSSYIVPYLRLIGYNLFEYIQTGPNFGTRQDHDIPTMCAIGRGTMVSGGLPMVNAKITSTSFKVARVHIGADSFLGNEIHYPAGAKAGRN